MDLKLNDSEIITIMNMIDEELSQDVINPMLKTTFKSLLTKINNNIEFRHHNEIDDFGIALMNCHYPEED